MLPGGLRPEVLWAGDGGLSAEHRRVRHAPGWSDSHDSDAAEPPAICVVVRLAGRGPALSARIEIMAGECLACDEDGPDRLAG